MRQPDRLCDLNGINGISGNVRLPDYNPQEHQPGIVHIGPGAFHRAHQAVYTDSALAASGGDWRITGISMRSGAVAQTLNPQNGLYTVIERGSDGSRARVIGSVDRIISLSNDSGAAAAAAAAMVAPATRIVSLTVTEKAYGIDRTTGGVDLTHPAVVADLANPENPMGVLGFLVEALRQRRKVGTAAFTILCCDNLPANGHLIKMGVLDFARRIDQDLADWIEQNATFPSSMVDRITPATSAQTLDLCRSLIGKEDNACVETEQFSQWVIEDDFALGRPDWESGGALFVKDVAPYEHMKLRMLNGAHSMLAYAGFLSQRTYVRDVMTDKDLIDLVRGHMQAAAGTLEPLGGMNYGDYADQLLERFKNPSLAHETYQIAMDGTQKLPQRLLLPAVDAIDRGLNVRPFAFAVAGWMRYCLGRLDDGHVYTLRDPRENSIATLLEGLHGAGEISEALHNLQDLFPPSLVHNLNWRELVEEVLRNYLDHGAQAAIAQEAVILRSI